MTEALENYRRRLREQLPQLAARYHVASFGLFGSYLKGNHCAGSDLDVLVTFDHPPSLFRLIELENYLSDLLAVRVDLVLRDSLKPRIGKRILQDVAPV